LVAEDDFSAEGNLDYEPAMVNGKETNMAEVEESLKAGAQILTELAAIGKA
jgi:hypothetical protein